jgi:hypothetical protein
MAASLTGSAGSAWAGTGSSEASASNLMERRAFVSRIRSQRSAAVTPTSSSAPSVTNPETCTVVLAGGGPDRSAKNSVRASRYAGRSAKCVSMTITSWTVAPAAARARFRFANRRCGRRWLHRPFSTAGFDRPTTCLPSAAASSHPAARDPGACMPLTATRRDPASARLARGSIARMPFRNA